MGGRAKDMIKADPKNVVYNAKRFMGMKWGDEGVESQIGRQGYQVVEKEKDEGEEVGEVEEEVEEEGDAISQRGAAAFALPALGSLLVTPEEVGSEVVKYLLSQVSQHLGHTSVTTAVIAVPAKFNALQRSATASAFKLAGLKVARVMDEPTAAALAYGLNRKEDVHHILVYDYGGGTLDVSVLHVSDGYVEVIGTAGDERLGGGDFDHVLGSWVWDEVLGEGERVERGTVEECGMGEREGTEWCTREDVTVMAERIKIEMSGIEEGEDRETEPQTCMR